MTPRMSAHSAEITARLRALRQIQNVSAQTLADRITANGYTISRAMIANFEGGRKNSIPVDYLIHAAEALGSDAVKVLTEPVPTCPACQGQPPAGFTCNTCGAPGKNGGESR